MLIKDLLHDGSLPQETVVPFLGWMFIKGGIAVQLNDQPANKDDFSDLNLAKLNIPLNKDNYSTKTTFERIQFGLYCSYGVVPVRSPCLIRSAPCILCWKCKIIPSSFDSCHPVFG